MKNKKNITIALLVLVITIITTVNIFAKVLAIDNSQDNNIRRCVVLVATENGANKEEQYDYSVNNDGEKTCTIIAYIGDYYSNIIPSTLDGYTVTRIGDGAFKNTEMLSGGIVIPESVIYIGDDAFSGCVTVTGITVGKNTKYIGNRAFSDCTEMMEMNLKNVEVIGDEAFKNCSNLVQEKLKFNDKIKSLGSKVFENCNLKEIEFTDTQAPSIKSDTFSGFFGKIIIPQANNTYTGNGWSGSYVIGEGLLGDINQDGIVNADDAADAIEIFKTNAQTEENKAKGDMNRDGKVDAEDAALIIEYFKTHK